MSYNTFHSFSVPLGKPHHITIKILGMDGQLHDVRLLADTGNDITLITRETAQSVLGINPDMIQGNEFDVFGITDQPVVAEEINNMVQIGSLRPVWIPMGIVSEYGAFAEDLLGRRGLLDNGLYEIIYDEDSVDFREKHMNMNMGMEENCNRPSSELRESFKAVRNPRFYNMY
jgi:hypothetical protein